MKPDRQLRITVNDRPLIGHRTGVGRYLERVCMHWPEGAGLELRGLLGRAAGQFSRPISQPRLESVFPLPLRPLSQARPPRESASFTRGFMRSAFRLGVGARQRFAARSTGLFWEPNHIPLAPTRPMVTTVHDLSVVEVPQYHPSDRVHAWRAHFERSLPHTDRFICVSRATGEAMTRRFGVDPRRIRVIHLAPTWPDRPDGWTTAACRAATGMPEDAVVHVGTIEPRKNIGVLLDAAQVRRRRGQRGTLVLLGGLGWGDRRFWEQLLRHPAAEHVLWADAPTDNQILAGLIAARGLVCPSFYEGFGLPPLEAMALGRRTVVSSAASLVEITGPTVPQLDPLDTEGWADAIGTLLEDDQSAERAVRSHAQAFSWSRTARMHAETFAELVR